MSGRGIDSSRCQRRCVRPLIVDDVETVVRAGIDSIGVAFVSDERVMPQLRAGNLSPCWRIGVSRSQAFSCITQAGGNSKPRFLI